MSVSVQVRIKRGDDGHDYVSVTSGPAEVIAYVHYPRTGAEPYLVVEVEDERTTVADDTGQHSPAEDTSRPFRGLKVYGAWRAGRDGQRSGEDGL